MTIGTPAQLTDLPRFSSWPARLLGLSEWAQRTKNAAEIEREYEHETWGPLLRRVREAAEPVTVREVNCWRHPKDTPIHIRIADGFRIAGHWDAFEHYIELVSAAVAQWLPATAVVELGCGYGAVLLSLARRAALDGVPLIGAEWTVSGRALTRTLAASDGHTVEAHACDLTSDSPLGFTPPEGAVLLTSAVFPCIRSFRPETFLALAKCHPKAVVHFEPFYEEYGQDDLWHLLVRRYIEVNDYNRDALGVLRELERRGAIRIVRHETAVFGSNSLLPLSLLVWQPADGR